MKNENIHVLLVNEVWEGEANFAPVTEKMFEIEGYEVVTSEARLSGKSIIDDTRYFTLKSLHITVPNKLEVKWSLLRPKDKSGPFSQIVLCSFYYPLKINKQKQILDHITETTHQLLTKYPEADCAIGGDKNEMNIKI